MGGDARWRVVRIVTERQPMRDLLHRSIPASATLAVAAVLTLVAVVMPVSPAHAAPAPGYGWSGSWVYYTPQAIDYSGTLPGVKLAGVLTDIGGSRASYGRIQDTADDGRCAQVWVFAAGHGIVSQTTTCGNGTVKGFSTSAFSTDLLLFVQLALPNQAGVEKSFIISIPSSANDAELRTVGTGANWSYTADTWFQYEVTRPGVKVIGHGAHQQGGRSSMNTVAKTVSASGCAFGRVTATTGNTISNAACEQTYTTFSTGTSVFGGQLNVDGCFYSSSGGRCTSLYIPEPA